VDGRQVFWKTNPKLFLYGFMIALGQSNAKKSIRRIRSEDQGKNIKWDPGGERLLKILTAEYAEVRRERRATVVL
jgi:hypothetical protein